MQDLQYPTPLRVSETERIQFINDIEMLPTQMRAAVEGLSAEQLDTPYRPQGWSLRQVVHHLPDSHANSYIRFKWALTEDQPVIKAYDEKLWAATPEASSADIEGSLNMLDGLHQRWVMLLKSMDEEDWKKSFIHPESNKSIPLIYNLALYSWHGKHHLGHITKTRELYQW